MKLSGVRPPREPARSVSLPTNKVQASISSIDRRMIAMKRNKVGHLIRTAVLLLLPLGAGAQAPAPRHSAEVAWGVSVPLGTGYPDKTGAAAFSLRYSTASHSGGRRSLSVAWGPYGRQRGVRRSLRRRRCNGLRRTHTAAKSPSRPRCGGTCSVGAQVCYALSPAPVSAASGTCSILPGRRSNTSKADSWGVGASAEVGTDLSAARGLSSSTCGRLTATVPTGGRPQK